MSYNFRTLLLPITAGRFETSYIKQNDIRLNHKYSKYKNKNETTKNLWFISYEDDYCLSSKRYQINYRIPMQSSVINELTYDDLICSSTPFFSSKHLILDYTMQQWLINFCSNQLRYGPDTTFLTNSIRGYLKWF